MKKCAFCGTNKNLTLFSYEDDSKKEIYICVDCLHEKTRKVYTQNKEENNQ